MIYFVRDPAAGLVKIGYSADAWRRISKIQSDCSGALTIEAVIEGGKDQEAALHMTFAAQRVRGEWFVWDGPVAAHVQTLETVRKARPVEGPPLKQWRRRSNVTLVDLGKIVGLSHAQVSRIERGGTTSLPLAIRLSALTGMPLLTFARPQDVPQ